MSEMTPERIAEIRAVANAERKTNPLGEHLIDALDALEAAQRNAEDGADLLVAARDKIAVVEAEMRMLKMAFAPAVPAEAAKEGKVTKGRKIPKYVAGPPPSAY